MVPCPRCGGEAHRSRTRGLFERLAKAATTYRAHRCLDCGWRGMLGADKPASSGPPRRKLKIAIALIITTALVFALMGLIDYTIDSAKNPRKKQRTAQSN